MNTTKQPLQIVDSLVYRLSDAFGTGVNVDEISVTMWGGHRNFAAREQGAVRVKACIDACEGLSTDELIAGKHTGVIRSVRRLTATVKQRDELLGILRKAISLLKDGAEPSATQDKADIGMCAQWDVDALELIAKAEASHANS